MNSRDAVLSRLRAQNLPPAPLPDLDGPWIRYPDPEKQFAEVLASVGGRTEIVVPADLEAAVRALPCLASAKKIVCAVPGLPLDTLDLASVADPHELGDVDVAILPGEFCVAENGAVWITDRALRHRVVCFIPQHLALVVPRAEIVPTMHDAYARLRFDGPGYGLFMSGPSKTADIEQSLVVGAHGSRSLTVFRT
jgi:L-lactate dehydrogenase complex protein LldG